MIHIHGLKGQSKTITMVLLASAEKDRLLSYGELNTTNSSTDVEPGLLGEKEKTG